jgi:branched-chain amino acid transport system ATP-binding protein
MRDRSSMIEAHGMTSGYAGVTVLKALDFTIGHEIFAILGANGAGKSTLMKTIAKILTQTGGTMSFMGDDVTHAAPYDVAQAGMAYVPQEQNIFPDLTVEENLSVGARLGRRPRQERLDEMFELFPDVRSRLRQKAGTLSGGEAQMVAVARALMQEPTMLLLDEPTAGLAPKYVDGLFGKLREIHQKHDVSILLAEQNATKALEVADRVMLLSLGTIFRIDATANIDSDALKEGYRI